MRYGLVISCLIVVLELPSCLLAQQQVFKVFTVNDGMVANGVRRIFQDNKGYIWIGTWEGLSRYDGNKFTNFTQANGLSHNLVNDIYESGNRLYITTNDGSVDLIENGIITKKIFGEVVINRINNYDPGLTLAVTDDKGLFEFYNGKLLRPTQVAPKVNYNHIDRLGDSAFVVATPFGVKVLNEKYQLISDLPPGKSFFSYCVFKDSKRRTWIGTNEGLKLISSQQESGSSIKFDKLPAVFNISALSQSVVRDIFEDIEGNIWFATVNGLVKLNRAGIAHQYRQIDGLPSDDVYCIYQDNERNIWIGTSLGLARLITRNNIYIYTTSNGLLTNQVGFLLPIAHQQILLSSGEGLQVFDSNRQTFRQNDNAGTGYYYGYVQNSRDVLLIKDRGIYRYESEKNIKDNITLIRKFPVIINLAAIDAQGNFMIADDDKLYCFVSDRTDNSAITFSGISVLYLDRKGILWAGTRDSGLFRIKYNINNNKLNIISKQHFLTGTHIRTLFEDSKGNLWAGTRFNGVYKFKDLTADSFKVSSYDQTNGLTSNWVRSVSEGANGAIWLGFYQGLDKLIPVNDDFRVFNFSRVNNLFANINNIVATVDKSVFVATSQSFLHITDGELENLTPNPVYITSVTLPDTTYNHGNADQSGKIVLKHRQNHLRFEFTSPSYINEKQVFYSYRLLGSFNSNWSQPLQLYNVSFASLQAGSYQFEVRSLGWNGKWGEPARFEFSIRPAFWNTTWFWIFMVTIVAVFIFWLVKRRISNIRRQAELKQKLIETEMMALRSQMNPHFLFNCLNSIDNLIQNNEKEKATRYLARFAKLMRAILENSRYEVIPVWKDMETLKLYLDLELLRCDHKFNYDLNVSEELQNGDYKLPPLVIQPFVENAIHHGLLNKRENDRLLSINASVKAGKIKFVIEDNGVGRKQAEMFKQMNKPAHQSLGLNITRDRIELHNENKNGESVVITDLLSENRPAGTRVSIMLENK